MNILPDGWTQTESEHTGVCMGGATRWSRPRSVWVAEELHASGIQLGVTEHTPPPHVPTHTHCWYCIGLESKKDTRIRKKPVSSSWQSLNHAHYRKKCSKSPVHYSRARYWRVNLNLRGNAILITAYQPISCRIFLSGFANYRTTEIWDQLLSEELRVFILPKMLS